MSVANFIRELREAGATPEVIEAAVRALENREEERKAKARERKRRERERKAQPVTECHATSRDVTGQSETVTAKKEAVSPTPPSEEKNNPPSPPKGGSSPRGFRLPDDWTLPNEWRQWAIEEGWPADRVDFEGKKFGDHWRAATGQNSRKRDWFAAWRNWMRNVPKNGPRTSENRRSNPHQNMFDAFAAAARDG